MPTPASPPVTNRELVMSRVIDAPRERVWKAWTDQQQLQKWWGPRGFTNPVCRFDARAGGAIRIDMRAPDGTVYPMNGVVREIVDLQRLVFASAALDAKGVPLFEVLNTVSFAERGGKTRLTLKAKVTAVHTAAAAKYVKGMKQGWSESLDRLIDPVAALADDAASRDLAIVRIIDAPREAVWKAWSDAGTLRKWWAPAPFTTPECDLDFRPGGHLRTLMRAPDGTEFPTCGIFLEVVEPQRIVFTDVLEPGYRPAQNPFFTAVITLEDHGGKTKYTARALHRTEADRERHEQMGFYTGWSTCIDQLAALTAQLDVRI